MCVFCRRNATSLNWRSSSSSISTVLWGGDRWLVLTGVVCLDRSTLLLRWRWSFSLFQARTLFPNLLRGFLGPSTLLQGFLWPAKAPANRSSRARFESRSFPMVPCCNEKSFSRRFVVEVSEWQRHIRSRVLPYLLPSWTLAFEVRKWRRWTLFRCLNRSLKHVLPPADCKLSLWLIFPEDSVFLVMFLFCSVFGTRLFRWLLLNILKKLFCWPWPCGANTRASRRVFVAGEGTANGGEGDHIHCDTLLCDKTSRLKNKFLWVFSTDNFLKWLRRTFTSTGIDQNLRRLV